MSIRLCESDFELSTIQRLINQGFTYMPAHEWIGRNDLHQVTINTELKKHLTHTYPTIPEQEINRLVASFIDVNGTNIESKNQHFYQLLTKGIDFKYEENGTIKYKHIYPIDWEKPENNSFIVMNQLSIVGRTSRRPDIIIFINGLPLVLFELKNPNNEDTTSEEAYTQITNYQFEIQQLFYYNAFSVVSDGVTTKHGIPFSPYEFFAEWKSIDGTSINNNMAQSMKIMIEGLFDKKRLLTYIRNFVTFMNNGKKNYKIGAKYHQFYGVLKALERTKESFDKKDKRLGVIWHTQGSGKSFSMMFLSRMLLQEKSLQNPTIIIQVDRSDLDDQLYEAFVEGQELVGNVYQAKSATHLRELLKNESGQIIFTTIEKFRIKDTEVKHPVLSEKENIIVMADEAHRTQYNETGYSGHLRDALPNASHIAFTGTPIDGRDKSTVEQFGSLIDVYDMEQAVLDKATVPIYYEPRLIPLYLGNEEVEEDFLDITGYVDMDEEQAKRYQKWATMNGLAGAQHRQELLAKDIVKHFITSAPSYAKGMIVCMSRENCISLYNELMKIPGCPEVEVVITGDIQKDPKSWRETLPGKKYSHIKTKDEQDEIKHRLRDTKDPLKLIIVRDMWLTGFDAKPLTYLYVDKPMKDHNLMQAIARVNRVFPEKEGGIIVDYINIADNLKRATKHYTTNGGKGNMFQDIDKAYQLFVQNLKEIRKHMPDSNDFRLKKWKELSRIETEDFIADLIDFVYKKDYETFLTNEKRLKTSYDLVKQLSKAADQRNEVVLYNMVATQIKKIKITTTGTGTKKEIEQQLKELIDKSIDTDGVLDILQIIGIEKADISILDDTFLNSLKDKKHIDLKVKILEQLIKNQIIWKLPTNNANKVGFKERLEIALGNYNANLLNVRELVEIMAQIKEEVEKEVNIYEKLGLTDDEMKFFEIVASMQGNSFTNEFIADLIHKTLQNMKKEFKIDWTQPHRQGILAKVKSAVRMTLFKEGIKGEQLKFLEHHIIEKAKQEYADWRTEA